MKRIFTEIGAVALLVLLYLLLPPFRSAILGGLVVISIWVVPVQLILCIDHRNWLDEMSGRYSHLNYDERLSQIRSKFKGLKEVEASKLRWFYIHVYLFHYLFFIILSLTIAALVLIFMYLAVKKSDPLDITLHLLTAIFIGFGGYFITGLIYPIKERRERDEIFHLLSSQDWRKRILEKPSDPDQSEISSITTYSTFYDFWLEGKTLTEKELAFKRFLQNLNKGSKNGPLFKFGDEEKIELVKVIDARALNKTLAGFLKFCIDDRKILSDRILKYSYRNLIRDVFILSEAQNLTFLETERVKSTPAEYSEVYKEAYESYSKIKINSTI